MEDKFQLVVPHRQPDVLQGLTNTFFLRIKVIIRISRCARNRIFISNIWNNLDVFMISLVFFLVIFNHIVMAHLFWKFTRVVVLYLNHQETCEEAIGN